MNKDSSLEKRQSKRYLCDDFFSHCSLKIAKRSLDLTAINFNKDGIGIFSNDSIPATGNVNLSIQYNNPELSREFNRLPCSIVYCNQTEVGSHCGIRFTVEELSPADLEALGAIEDILIKCDDPDDRYHLFGDD